MRTHPPPPLTHTHPPTHPHTAFMQSLKRIRIILLYKKGASEDSNNSIKMDVNAASAWFHVFGVAHVFP